MKLVEKNIFPFKIEPIEGKDALTTQEIGYKALGDYHRWVTSGNLLGMYRDKKLIPYDTDIDVNVLLKEGEVPILDIIDKMSAVDFIPIRMVTQGDSPMQLAFMDSKRSVIFDIYFFYEKGDIAYNNNPEGRIEKPMKFLKPLGALEFEGVTYNCPNHLEEYLVWRFGNDWKTPTGKKVPWQEEANHLTSW